MKVNASIYEFSESSTSYSNRDLWAKICFDLSSNYPDIYRFDKDSHFKVVLKNQMLLSPTKQLARFRVIRASIRRMLGKPALMDISVSNRFSSIESGYCDRVESLSKQYPSEAKWIRRAQRIGLSEHIQLINIFLKDLDATGWRFANAKLGVSKLSFANIHNGSEEFSFDEVSIPRLIKNPYRKIPANTIFVVGSSDPKKAKIVADRLRDRIPRLLGVSSNQIPTVVDYPRLSKGNVNLWVLDDNLNFLEHSEFRDRIRSAEQQGIKFKFCKYSNTSNVPALTNIIYDMCLMAGLVPYVTVDEVPNICSVDAGHNSKQNLSRWVYVESLNNHSINKVKVFDTELAEHLPENLVNEFWPKLEDTIYFRDGRFTQEKSRLKTMALRDNVELIECKKSPASIIWRSVGGENFISNAGDCVVDPHGEILLQTIKQNNNDYVRPIRLKSYGYDVIGAATIFFQHQTMPTFSIYNSPRLPGSLYYADLISKLTKEGWPKVVGRGLGLSKIIP